MIATRPISALFRTGGSNALDLPVAALAGLSVAFAAFTIPGDLLAEAVGASGLPTLLDAAQPPLGMTARVAIAVAGALATFALAFSLLRWLDRFGSRPAAPAARILVPAEDAPRLRKRDLHPDAPAPRPISAARDLGEPAPPMAMPSWAAPEPEAAPLAQPAQSSSLGELMSRLEAGLMRRAGDEEAAPPEAPRPRPRPSAADDRLQSAIDSLQRLAARHD